MSNLNEMNQQIGNGACGDCREWERRYAELIDERRRLQAQLTDAEAENKANTKALAAVLGRDFKFDLTMEQVFAQVDRESSVEQLIAEFEVEMSKRP